MNVLVGGLAPEAETLIQKYIDAFVPEASLKAINPMGAKGTILKSGSLADCIFIVLDESVWNQVYKVCEKVLSQPKAHKYTNISSLNNFLISKFGNIEESQTGSTSEPIQAPKLDDEEDMVITGYREDYSTSVEESKIKEEYETKIHTLEVQLESNKALIENLQAQLQEEDISEVNSLVETINDLKSQLEEKDKQISSMSENMGSASGINPDEYYNAIGKATRAENIIKDFEATKQNLAQSEQDNAKLQHDISTLTTEKAELETKISELDKSIEDMTKSMADLNVEIKSKSVEIERLQADIDEKDELLTSQEADIKGKEGEIALLQEKSTELNNLKEVLNQTKQELADKVAEYDNLNAELGTVTADYEEATAQIQSLNERIDAKEQEITDLNKKIIELTQSSEASNKSADELNTIIADLKSTIAKQEEQLNEQEQQIVDLNSVVQGKEEELSTKVSELTTVRADLKSATDLVEDKTKEVEGMLDEIKKKDTEISSLKEQTEQLENSHNDEVAELQNQITNLKDNLQAQMTQNATEQEAQIANLNEQINKLNDNNTAYSQQITALKTDISQKEAKIAQLTDELSNKENQIVSLTSNATDNTEQMSVLQSEIDEKETEIAELKKSIDAQLKEIKELKEHEILIKDQIQGKDDAISTVIEEKNKAVEELTQSKQTEVELNGKIADLNKQIEDLNNANTLSAQSTQQITALKEKAEREVENLKAKLNEATVDTTVISQLETDLLEEKRKSTRLASELDVLKKSNDASKTTDLRKEITQLKEDLAKAQKDLEEKNNTPEVDSFEVTQLKQELTDARQRAAIFEMEIADKEEQLSEFSNTPFYQMASIALPKKQVGITTPISTNYFENHYYCYASGSDESSSVVFKNIRRSCIANPKAKIVILDLSTDSTIDGDFNVGAVKNPVSWLSGSEDVGSALSTTGLANVQIISTALTYMNDLYFLSVDWDMKIREILKYTNADCLIVYVGCLNNLISKIMFNTFSQVMRSHIIVKATPINIRSVLLTITGLPINVTTTIDCVNFDKSSEKFYQKLASKYKATIIRESDLIVL